MKTAPRRKATSPEFLLPQPSDEGVAELRALHLRRTGKEISEDQARDVLGRVMRFQYLNFLINAPCSGTDSTPENPTTTGR